VHPVLAGIYCRRRPAFRKLGGSRFPLHEPGRGLIWDGDLHVSNASDSDDGPETWVPHACVPWGLVLLAFAVRSLPVRSVFVDGQTFFTDGDSYYHLRRIAYNLASFPETLARDPYLNFPSGAEAIWPQTMDWVLALLLLPLGVGESAHLGAEGSRDFEIVLVWIAPVLGALTVGLLYRIASQHFGARIALVSALVLSVLPAHFWYSQVGFLDHHVLVALNATLLLGATMNLVRRCDEAGSSRRTTWRSGIGWGALLAINVMTWPGALLYIALGEATLFALAVASSNPETRTRALDCLLLANLTAFVLVAPFCVGNHWSVWGTFSAVVLSNFQPWLFAILASQAAASSFAFDRLPAGSMASRIAVSIPVGLALLGTSVAFIPGLETSVLESAQWLGRTDAFQAMVGESVPLFVLHGKFTTEIASSRLSYFVYLFPVAVIWLCVERRIQGHRPSRYSFVAWALVLFAFTLLQKRFFNTFSIALALTMGAVLVTFSDVVRERFALGRTLRIGCVTAIAIGLLWPSFLVYRGALLGILGTMVGEPPAHTFRTDINLARREMTTWLRRNTPETAGYLDSQGEPEYGILARWGEGHFINYVARRPAVMGNFGDDLGRDHFLLARSFFTAEPEHSDEILTSLKVRYVVIRSMSESRAMAKTLFAGDGSRLGRYRLLHEVRPFSGTNVPSYKIFEFVKGADVSGTAPARSLVVAELDLVTNLGRKARFEMVTEADSSGQYRLRLPYATGTRGPDATHTADRYQIRIKGSRQPIAIGEQAIQSGSPVVGPHF
jgi:asparagine N-glycosylation enzyme membrane subunit Stt3